MKKLLRGKRGSVSVKFALLGPLMLMAAGLGIDGTAS